MSISRRLATENDFAFAKDVQHEAYRDWALAQFGSTDEKTRNRFFEVSWKRWAYEIITYADVDCGFCAIELADDASHLREFAIAADYRGKGIGGTFLRALVDELASRNLPFYLRVFRANTRAIRFYRRVGFVEVDSTETQLIFCVEGTGAET